MLWQYTNASISTRDSTKRISKMGVQYDGKSPGKGWYFWQKTKALAKTPFNHTTRKDAGRFAKDAGITVGILAAANVALSVPVLMAAPILPWVIGAAAITFAFKYGRDAWSKFGALKETAAVTNYVREQENNWYDKQARKPLLTRVKEGFKKKVDAIPAPAIKALKFIGLGVAVAGLATGGAIALGAFGLVPALAPLAATIVEAGAAIGLTATAATATAIGLTALAAPAAGVATYTASNASILRRDPANSPFKFKKPSEGAKPISQGEVFTPGANGKSFDFNSEAAPATPTANDNALSEQRRKAAEERAKNKKNRDNSKKF